MKKNFLFSLIVLMILCLSSCGAKWEQSKKNWKSDLNGGIVRTVKVYDSFTKETIFEYTGKCYLSDGSTCGDFTLICYDKNGESKKVDFLGNGLAVAVIEN